MKINFKIVEFDLSRNLALVVGAVLILAALSSLGVAIKTNFVLGKKLAVAKEAERPANLQLTIIKAKDCVNCFDINQVVGFIKKEKVKIESEKEVELTSPEGSDLVKKYNLEKAPGIIIEGEVEKSESLKTILSKMGDVQDGVFVLRKSGAPYILTDSGDVRGEVKVTLIKDSKCSKCYDVERHKLALSALGVPINDIQVVELTDAVGWQLKNKYKIKVIPTMILTGDLDVYDSLKGVWSSVGTVEKDGAYVFRNLAIMGAYKDLTNGKVVEPKNE